MVLPLNSRENDSGWRSSAQTRQVQPTGQRPNPGGPVRPLARETSPSARFHRDQMIRNYCPPRKRILKLDARKFDRLASIPCGWVSALSATWAKGRKLSRLKLATQPKAKRDIWAASIDQHPRPKPAQLIVATHVRGGIIFLSRTSRKNEKDCLRIFRGLMNRYRHPPFQASRGSHSTR